VAGSLRKNVAFMRSMAQLAETVPMTLQRKRRLQSRFCMARSREEKGDDEKTNLRLVNCSGAGCARSADIA
jgi:hypothetical protein